MKNLLLLSLLLCLNLSAWSNELNWSKQVEYAQIKPYLELLNIHEKNVQIWRENVAQLDFYEEIRGNYCSLQRTGKWQDEIKIQTIRITLIIPEWCLLVYLQEIENQMISKENLSKKIIRI